MIRTLADLVSPASLETFREHFKNRERLWVRATEPRRAESLLPWSEIDRLIACDAIPHDWFRVLLKTNEYPQRGYRRTPHEPELGAAKTHVLQDLAAQGATFVVDHIQKQVPRIAELAGAIERELSHFLNVNCYVSFGQHSAFLQHHDPHDIIVVQIHGSKRWRCYGVDLPDPVEKMRRPPQVGPAIWEGVLQPGDVLYLPRGEVHAAVPEDRPSVHLTIGITVRTGVNFITRLAEKAVDEPLFRKGFSRIGGPRQLAEREKEMKQALHALIESTSVAEFLEDDDHGRKPRSLAAFDLAARLRPESELLAGLRRRIDLAIDDDGEREIKIGGIETRLSALARRALHVITDRSRLTYAALAAELGLPAGDPALIESLADLGRKALIGIED
jgi:hypothetical protein